MASSIRGKWMAQRIVDSQISSDQQFQSHNIFNKEHFQIIENFVSGRGPAAIFVFESEQQISAFATQKIIKIQYGDEINEKVETKIVYFYRTTDANEPPEDVSGSDRDSKVVFGQLNHNIAHILNVVVNFCYKPQIMNMQSKDFETCAEQQINEFYTSFEIFSLSLNNSSLCQPPSLILDEMKEKEETAVEKMQKSLGTKKSKQQSKKSADVVVEDKKPQLFNKWMQQIKEFIDQQQKSKNEADQDSESDPRYEIEYWKQRMRNLDSISRLLEIKVKAVCDQLSDKSEALKAFKQQDDFVKCQLLIANDNMKYLETLQKFLPTLEMGKTHQIIQILPDLLNSLYMIYTYSRFFNNKEIMTNLVKKITNQMIKNCKYNVVNMKKVNSSQAKSGIVKRMNKDEADMNLWDNDDYPKDQLIDTLQSCIDLFYNYMKQYETTRDQSSLTGNKLFDLDPQLIFGQFDAFAKRCGKLVEIFGNIHQFDILREFKLERLQPIIAKFDLQVQTFIENDQNSLLEYNDRSFEPNYTNFMKEVKVIESDLNDYIDQNFEVITKTEESLGLLQRFTAVIRKESLKQGLQSKYILLFQNYALEIKDVEDQYLKYRNSPPMVRNLSTVAGNITWSRHLYHRIQGPMELFPKDLLSQKDKSLRKIIKTYNKIGYTLFQFEYLWKQKWISDIQRSKSGLEATLIIRHHKDNKLYVNFDLETLTLIREAKCLSRLGIEIPESAKIVVSREYQLKLYYSELLFILKEYSKLIQKIRPNMKSLLVPTLEDFEYKLRPGLVTLTWTSINIDGYLNTLKLCLEELESLIINVNDIIENRIENNIDNISKTVLVDLPVSSRTFTLDEFVEMQEDCVNKESQKLKSKNFEVEAAVEDLIKLVCLYKLHEHVSPIDENEIIKIQDYYGWLMYQALFRSTQISLNKMKERICGGKNVTQTLKPFFEVDVYLDIDSEEQKICFEKPSLFEVQTSINRAASAVLKSTKFVQMWGQKDLPEEERAPFYDKIAEDKEIVKVILLLTGSIQGTKDSVNKFLESFQKFQSLQLKKLKPQLQEFNDSDPQLGDFERKFDEFTFIEKEVNSFADKEQLKIQINGKNVKESALILKTSKVKEGLLNQIDVWKKAFSEELLKRVQINLDIEVAWIKRVTKRLQKQIEDNDIDAVGIVMNALEEVRTKQSVINTDFKPILQMQGILEQYFDEELIDWVGNKDPQTVLSKDWPQLLAKSVHVRNELIMNQSMYKKSLIKAVKALGTNVKKFREDFETNGPMVPGIEPREALNRLKLQIEEFWIRERKYKSLNAGETLFGLPNATYPELELTKSQLELLEKLYNLYVKVKDTTTRWKEILWTDMWGEVESLIEQIGVFSGDVQKLPLKLRQWNAFRELKEEIDELKEVLPLAQGLAKPSIQTRHWEEIRQITGAKEPKFTERGDIVDEFCFKDLLKIPLLKHKEEIEDITDSADKQEKISTDYKAIVLYWQMLDIEIITYKGIECSILGGSIIEIQEKLENDIMALSQMNAQRYVKPFKNAVVNQITNLSEAADTIEKWLKVQTLWTNLVSVFTGGDIARQMPKESQKFKIIDKKWLKIMEKAKEQRNVLVVTSDDVLKALLPSLQNGLEVCQKKLENYLEGKKYIFPRFYFCSNDDLLQILSVGSDPHKVQDDFEKLFDAINRVNFDTFNRKLIVEFMQVMGESQEVITLIEPVEAIGNIEEWLVSLELAMQSSIRSLCKKGARDCFQLTTEEFTLKYPSQIALIGIQILWTSMVGSCLERPNKEKIIELKKKSKDIEGILTDLTQMCLQDMDRQIRIRVETLVTIHVRQREVFEDIKLECMNYKIKDSSDFSWTKNTRVYWKGQENQCEICITDITFQYSYEFLGAKERLCITPLTDRCYITLSQALGMLYGGAPAGPAGTGKTETVKDLGRTLGIFVVVVNCSDEHKYRDMAKIFKGISQSGLWGCFDEFNRISLATLSVVAAQVESITYAKKANLKKFWFPNEVNEIRLVKSCGYFITMNPGYAGRQELPENLKVLFRGVTMMVPNRQVIMMVKLASVGYVTYQDLSFKFDVLYKLCEEQLSKQRHYDFGLRNILSVLRTAGNSKRQEPSVDDEEMIMARTLRDMNLSKFVAQDIPLFLQLLNDIFPLQKNIKTKTYKDVEIAIQKMMIDKNLQIVDDWKIKVIQLYETSLVRHGFMLVGSVGSGKTTIMNVLTDALSETVIHKLYRLNPKSITGQQMYGVMNNTTGEWVPGVFSQIWKKCNAKYNKHTSWIVCDGPVDAIWVENLNTVLDDNKILTLANAERIPMSESTKLTFEVENLDNASPATVSRCGIIFVSKTDLYWKPLIYTWIKDREKDKLSCHADEGTWLKDCVQKFVDNASPKFSNLFSILEKDFTYVMPCPEVVRINQLLNLLTGLLDVQIKEQKQLDLESFEKLFIYAMTWALAGLFEQDDRNKFHKVLEDIGAPLPQITSQGLNSEMETVFDYYVCEKNLDWKLWQTKQWVPPKKIVFSQLLMPTVESTRTQYIIDKISSLPPIRSKDRNEHSHRHTLLVGGPGTAKTSIIIMHSNKSRFTKDPPQMLFKRMNLSSLTTPYNFQESIDGVVEKKNVRTYTPIGQKPMTIFLDDISMPYVNTWGDQVTLEFARQLIELKYYYFLSRDETGSEKKIELLQFLGAMSHPGGGRNDIPHRLKRHFFSINITPPSEKSIQNIYGRILEVLFDQRRYKDDSRVTEMKNPLVIATIDIWEEVKNKILPTPSKFHYIFSIRELARVFQGICVVVDKPKYGVIQECSNIQEENPTPQSFLVTLWRHECQRTFKDKLVNSQDKCIFDELLDKVTSQNFNTYYQDELGQPPMIKDYLFADFQREDTYDDKGNFLYEASPVYEPCPSMESIRKKIYARMQEYNEKNASKAMNLVIFDDAVRHLLRITRVVSMPGGSSLLVGVGGSGKQSLTKLGSFICGHMFFQIHLTKSYNELNLKEDIKNLYKEAGPNGKGVSFMMTDAEIKSETFLEAINSFLATGEIPGLIPKDERDHYALDCRGIFQKENGKGSDGKALEPTLIELWAYFIRRVQNCLHIILAFSPVGKKLSERSQQFPSLFSQCSIDWFLPWPEEALVSVAHKKLQGFEIQSTEQVRRQLEKHMGKCHNDVNQVCEQYFKRMRRHVYVTPKSFLSFVDLYMNVYQVKYEQIDQQEQSIIKGLSKLLEAKQDVEILKDVLVEEDQKIIAATERTDKLLQDLEIENLKAKKKGEEVAVIKDNCIKYKDQITIETADAEKDLARALPYLRAAEKAVDSIQSKDISELGTTIKALDTTKFIMDPVHILFQRPLDKVKLQNLNILRQDIPFIGDSYETHTKNTLKSNNFLKDLLDFSKNNKDSINEETIELLEPYITAKTPAGEDLFKPAVAKKASAALEGMCTWAAAMSDYHKQSKIVKPKQKILEMKMQELEEAEANLAVIEKEFQDLVDLKERLRNRVDTQLQEKSALQEKSNKTRRKMEQANRLIKSLEENERRWNEQKKEFNNTKLQLAGDVAKACAFVSYCGPFNSEFRTKLLKDYFHEDLLSKEIPCTSNMQLTSFLADRVLIGEWNQEGLPSDDLSIQNGIMVTRSSRYPLMIDPQNQAYQWILNREPILNEQGCILNLNNPDFRYSIRLPLSEGWPILIESIENEIDPFLDPILEKQFVSRGGKDSKLNLFIKLADQEYDFSMNFRLYMTSRLANPHFLPELAAKTTIIDFTVTQDGLEQQLLARLISKEQKPLEDQIKQLQEEVTQNTKRLSDLEDDLLLRLSLVEGSLIEDPEIVEVLATIKVASLECTQTLQIANEKKIEIDLKREMFRPIAARGSVLYFCIVEMSLVNWMYNTSLQQFLGLFDYGIDASPKANNLRVEVRVSTIIEWLTRRVYRYMNRGLFEKDKITFKLLISTRLLIGSGLLSSADVDLLLKAGGGIDDTGDCPEWMNKKTWLNLKALAYHKFANQSSPFFQDILRLVEKDDEQWKMYFDEAEPEKCKIPSQFQEMIDDERKEDGIGHFMHLCFIRSVREDRTLVASQQFIKETLGNEYILPITDTIQEIFLESGPTIPVLYLLSKGADPTGQIDEFSHKRKQNPGKVSMGEEMEIPALKLIEHGLSKGTWVILNNCHLSLEFMGDMEEILKPTRREIHKDFRLWITCEPHVDFPLGLLQMSIKATTEPPKGLQAGISRTFQTMINPDFLEKVEPFEKWRSIVFAVCFMHSVVQERRKFGPLGFNIPYEFNNSDLEASLMFIEKHMTQCFSNEVPYSWKALQYMVCEVQYGGRITDSLDRELFKVYGQVWIQEQIFTPNYCFNGAVTEFSYCIPIKKEYNDLLEYITKIPDVDGPTIFGLHPNADLTFRQKESQEMINVLLDTKPKESSESSGLSREDQVKEKIKTQLIPMLPKNFDSIFVREKIKHLPAPAGVSSGSPELVPLNIFLNQEIQRFQIILNIVRQTLDDMSLAIDGSIIMTSDLVESINAIFDFRVPKKWLFDPTGVEISWLVPSLAGWIKGLLDRHRQLNEWLYSKRPMSFWITGFFNPQGFLTSMKQEVTRQHSAEQWSIDKVEYFPEVMKDVIYGDDGKIDPTEIRGLKPVTEGVYIHGLFIEGAGWSKAENRIEDSQPKELYKQFPIIYVTAVSMAQGKGDDLAGGLSQKAKDLQNKKLTDYSCPVYKYPKRNDRYLIFRCYLKAESQGAPQHPNKGLTASMKWKLSGVALLCCKD